MPPPPPPFKRSGTDFVAPELIDSYFPPHGIPPGTSPPSKQCLPCTTPRESPFCIPPTGPGPRIAPSAPPPPTVPQVWELEQHFTFPRRWHETLNGTVDMALTFGNARGSRTVRRALQIRPVLRADREHLCDGTADGQHLDIGEGRDWGAVTCYCQGHCSLKGGKDRAPVGVGEYYLTAPRWSISSVAFVVSRLFDIAPTTHTLDIDGTSELRLESGAQMVLDHAVTFSGGGLCRFQSGAVVAVVVAVAGGWVGGGGAPPPAGRPADAQPLSHWRQAPGSTAFVTDSNRPQPPWQPPPTAGLTASGTASKAPSLLLLPCGGGCGGGCERRASWSRSTVLGPEGRVWDHTEVRVCLINAVGQVCVRFGRPCPGPQA